MKLVPPSSNLRGTGGESVPGFPTHSLVLYEHEGQLLLGAVVGFKRQRFVIFNERGREVELIANRLHAAPGSLPHDLQSQDARKEHLQALAERARALAPSVAIQDLWEVVHHSPKEFSVNELLDLVAPREGGSAEKSAAFIGLFHALTQDKVFFKRERQGFLPRPPATVEQLRGVIAALTYDAKKKGRYSGAWGT